MGFYISDFLMNTIIDLPTMLVHKLKDLFGAPTSKALNERLLGSVGHYTAVYAIRKGAALDKPSEHPVHTAIRYNHPRILKALQERGLDFDKPYAHVGQGSGTQTALEAAVRAGSPKLVRLLIDQYGASPHLPAPGHLKNMAQQKGFQDVFDLLEQKEKDFPLPGSPVPAAQPQPAPATPSFNGAFQKPLPAGAVKQPMALRRPGAGSKLPPPTS